MRLVMEKDALMRRMVLMRIRCLGKQVVFVTNNSTKSRSDYKKKLDGLGIPGQIVRKPVFSQTPPAEPQTA